MVHLVARTPLIRDYANKVLALMGALFTLIFNVVSVSLESNPVALFFFYFEASI